MGTDERAWWTLHRGASPVVGTAIHNGHALPPTFAANMVVSDETRLREEDPYTEFMIRDLPNRIVVHQSRFAVDLNRAREAAIYRKPEQSWGMQVFSNDFLPARSTSRPICLKFRQIFSLVIIPIP